MLVHVLLYEAGTEAEGIHSIELNGSTIVLMFEAIDDAERYCLLLEAQDFPCPTAVKIDREEIELFCTQSGYEYRFVDAGFIPRTEEERLFLSPPEKNRDTTSWKNKSSNTNQDELEEIRKRLEGLL